MDFDDYERHIIQKYRLLVAISVLKTKPEETSVEKHITELKNKFDDKMDPDITMCSDDFNLDDDTDFDIINNHTNEIAENNDDVPEYNDTQLLETDFNDDHNSKRLFNDSDVASGHNSNKLTDDKKKEFSDVIYIFKDIGHEHKYDKPQHNKTHSQSTYCGSLQHDLNATATLERLPNNEKHISESIVNRYDENIDFLKYHNERPRERQLDVNKEVLNVVEREDQSKDANIRSNERYLSQGNEVQILDLGQDNNLTYYDSQATEIYTLHGFTQNYTHISQSQNCDFDISEKFITGINKNGRPSDSKLARNGSNINETKQSDNIYSELVTDNVSKNQYDKGKMMKLDNKVIQNYGIEESEKYISKTLNGNKENSKEIYDVTQNNTTNMENTQIDINDNSNRVSLEKLSAEKCLIPEFSENAQRDHYSVDYMNLHETNGVTNTIGNSKTENSTDQMIFVNKSKESAQNAYSLGSPNDLIIKDNKIVQESNIVECEEAKVYFEDVSEPELTLHIELVPFKVVEELNRVKTFLNRRERRMSYDGSSDSGYKSDSQGRNLRGSVQLSGAWLNQSAHCLYDYITRCPLVYSTGDITDEISQVLGELIDKLHEEEVYPVFLEELFDYHNHLIQEVHTAAATILDTDQSIQRFLLINKSAHILKYSIEKLTDALENIYKKLIDQENLCELANIIELENTAYIFHILEIIIKRYLKSKNIIENTQSSQNSDDNIMKKSSITDIWRRKWNPNYRDDIKTERGLEKKCVITKCSELLNKIVVECMSEYSLVAFAALQCFNLLQS